MKTFLRVALLALPLLLMPTLTLAADRACCCCESHSCCDDCCAGGDCCCKN